MLRNRDAENTHLAHGLQDFLGYSEVVPVDALGAGGDDVSCQALKGGLHHGFLVAEPHFTDVSLESDDFGANFSESAWLCLLYTSDAADE